MKRWREKEEEFRQHCYRNSSAKILARVKKKQLRQCHCQNRKKKKLFFGNYGNGIVENEKKN